MIKNNLYTINIDYYHTTLTVKGIKLCDIILDVVVASCSCTDIDGIDDLNELFNIKLTQLQRKQIVTTFFNAILKEKMTRFLLISTTTNNKKLCALLDSICKVKTLGRKSVRTSNICKIWIY